MKLLKWTAIIAIGLVAAFLISANAQKRAKEALDAKCEAVADRQMASVPHGDGDMAEFDWMVEKAKRYGACMHGAPPS
jgi:hypothetical protein